MLGLGLVLHLKLRLLTSLSATLVMETICIELSVSTFLRQDEKIFYVKNTNEIWFNDHFRSKDITGTLLTVTTFAFDNLGTSLTDCFNDAPIFTERRRDDKKLELNKPKINGFVIFR